MSTNKEKMLRSLPLNDPPLTIRQWKRDDIDKLAQWPKYPWPNENFAFSFSKMNSSERNSLFKVRQKDPSRITLLMDHINETCIGYIALLQIDFAAKTVGDMAVRVEPSRCNMGIGTRILLMVTNWCFGAGIQLLRLSVAVPNIQAVRCYEKAGFIKTEEFWQPDKNLKGINVIDQKYDFLWPHVRFDNAMPLVRFCWMERKKEGR